MCAPSSSLPRRENSSKDGVQVQQGLARMFARAMPPLTTGILVASANSATDPVQGWRMTMRRRSRSSRGWYRRWIRPWPWTKREARGVADEPPRRQNAAPKLTRVRVLALEEQVAQHRAFQHPRYLLAARNGLHHIRHAEQVFHRFAGELIDRQQLMAPLRRRCGRARGLPAALRIFLQQVRGSARFH